MTEETKLTPIDTNVDDINKLQKSYDELYAKFVQISDEFEERNTPVDPGVNKEVVTYSAEVTCDATYPGYVYFRIDEDMTKVNNIYVDVYPVSFRSPITL
jgi:hypothetical protein